MMGVWLTAMAVAGMLGGCSTDLAPAGSHFVVSVQRAEFYKYGPAQSFGADFVLPQGQRVIMLSRQFGFSRVMTEDGVSGWIASDEIRPAPPEVRSKQTPGGRRGGSPDRMFSGPKKNSRVEPVPGDPLFDMSDLPPPPLPENPDLPKPKFRVSPPKPH